MESSVEIANSILRNKIKRVLDSQIHVLNKASGALFSITSSPSFQVHSLQCGVIYDYNKQYIHNDKWGGEVNFN